MTQACSLDDIASAIRAAHGSRAVLRIRGAGSKDFYGGMLAGDVLDVISFNLYHLATFLTCRPYSDALAFRIE